MIPEGRHKSGRIGVDIGGTFTDVVLELDGRRLTHKVLTTRDNPAEACMQGISRVLAEADAAAEDIEVLIHGTTLATNAIIERKGAVTSMVTTAGFRDVIEIGTEGRPEQYDINILKPEPLVPRRRRFAVPERLDRNGDVLLPAARLRPGCIYCRRWMPPALNRLRSGFCTPTSTRGMRRRARDYVSQQRRPGWSYSLSSEISPEFREFERFSTTCANAYVQPLISSYLEDFELELRRRGFSCPVLLMLSSGGLTSVETARRFPVRLVESGPAGGAIFAAEVSRRCKAEAGDFLRHGRNHCEDLHARLCRAPDEPPVRSRSGLQVPQGQRTAAAHSGHRHGGNRSWRRIDRPHRRTREVGRWPRKRRLGTRPVMLRTGRNPADRHRWVPCPRADRPRQLCRRRHRPRFPGSGSPQSASMSRTAWG